MVPDALSRAVPADENNDYVFVGASEIYLHARLSDIESYAQE